MTTAAPLNEFSITETVREDGATIVVATGDLDLATSPQLALVLTALARQERATVVDLSAVTFLDSSGLAVLLRANTEAARGRWSLKIAPELSEAVALVFRLTSATEILTLEHDA
jgi:anti-sigma B factor antagonist